MRALITGISGQDGAYLAKFLWDRGYEIIGTSRDAATTNFRNLIAIGLPIDRIKIISLAPSDFGSVLSTIKKYRPDEIYNLTAQSSVALSFTQPLETLEGIVNGTINFLEAIRILETETSFYNAGSSECFGNTPHHGADECTPFQPKSPYGIAKAAAYWTVANYRNSYGMKACSGILFNHESPLRPERFVTRKIVTTACRIRQGASTRLQLGNLSIKRDWGYAPEYVDAMWKMTAIHRASDDFVIATGACHSLQEFVERVFLHLGLNWLEYVDFDSIDPRPNDITFSLGNANKAKKILSWAPDTDFDKLIELLVLNEMDNKIL